jgi:hypothetical protein
MNQVHYRRLERAIARVLRTEPELRLKGACLICDQTGSHHESCPLYTVVLALAPLRGTFDTYEAEMCQSVDHHIQRTLSRKSA